MPHRKRTGIRKDYTDKTWYATIKKNEGIIMEYLPLVIAVLALATPMVITVAKDFKKKW